MSEKTRYLRLFQKYQKTILIVVLIFVVNLFAASVCHSYFTKSSWIFYGKSQAVILSDLLFLEGAIVFALGTLVASMKPWVSRTLRDRRHKSDVKEELDNDTEKPAKNRVDVWILTIMIGLILMASSIAIGSLFL